MLSDEHGTDGIQASRPSELLKERSVFTMMDLLASYDEVAEDEDGVEAAYPT